MAMSDVFSDEKIAFVAQKWGIPEDEAERMLRNQRANETGVVADD